MNKKKIDNVSACGHWNPELQLAVSYFLSSFWMSGSQKRVTAITTHTPLHLFNLSEELSNYLQSEPLTSPFLYKPDSCKRNGAFHGYFAYENVSSCPHPHR
jgi:hypothetical protein